ncbi:MAG: polysaccharide deacetylase family protein [Deltaproteobacteria bacterium]|nr:polysaccharide deacetylase family protein [Deltaproteobacteria bacterium]
MGLEGIKKRLVNCGLFFKAASWATRKSPRVFMYHRFSSDDRARGRVSAHIFKWQLGVLSKGWRVITLGEYTAILRRGQSPPSYTVVLTVDDGYRDFYKYAYPCLREFSLPATFFPTVNFLDGKWLWWDRINYAFEKTGKKKFVFEFSGKSFDIDLGTAEKKERSCLKLSDFCVKADNDLKWALIGELEKGLDVKMPPSPAEDYRAVSWEELKELHANGIEIGSHTLDHPIVSRIGIDTLKKELSLSKARLEEFLGAKVASFCYPNGKRDDLNGEVRDEVEKAGYAGAVVSYNATGAPDLYRIPRMGADADRVDFLWKLCGMETFVQRLKRRIS